MGRRLACRGTDSVDSRTLSSRIGDFENSGVERVCAASGRRLFYEPRGCGNVCVQLFALSTAPPEKQRAGTARVTSNASTGRATRFAASAIRTTSVGEREGSVQRQSTSGRAFPFRVWSKLVARYCEKSAVQAHCNMAIRWVSKSCAKRLVRYLRAARSVRCEWQQIMIVSGSQQALDISARVLLESGSSVWVEEPGYWLTRHILTAAGCRLVPVPVDNDGLDVAAGIERCRKARAAYVAPSHQYPLGATMSASRRLATSRMGPRLGGVDCRGRL